MKNIYISPQGNPEVWSFKPDGYYTADEWNELNTIKDVNSLTPEEISEIAKDISMTKAEFLLLVTNLSPITLAQIEEYVDSDPDIKIRFTYANSVERNHPLLDRASLLFGISSEILDIMFVQKDYIIEKINNGEQIEGISV